MREKVVILQGGTGNQLWQHAFAHKLAGSSPVKLVEIVDSDKRKAPSLINELSANCGHGISYEQVSRSSFRIRMKMIPESKYFKLSPSANRFLDVRNVHWSQFQELDLTRYEVFLGYFQSVDFLKNEVRKVLMEMNELEFESFDNCKRLSSRFRGFIHIRGGDYLQERNREIFGSLAESYYSTIEETVEGNWNSEYVVFTNDRKHAIQVLPRIKEENILDSTSISVKETLAVMANCGIAVIANSSFSWWGGMASKLRGGKIVAPYPWRKIEMADPTLISDLYQDDFNKMQAIYE